MQALLRRMTDSSEGAVREGAQLSTASTEVAARVLSVADSVQSLRTAIDEIDSGARGASSIADTALHHSLDAITRFELLTEASCRIGEVTDVITSITAQTKMLALNATIEAARAGVAGRGFAVVAGEVKALAGATSAAAERIAAQVTAVQDETSAAAGALEEVTQTIRQVKTIQDTVRRRRRPATAASSGIAVDVDEASRGSARIAELVAGRAGVLRRSYVDQALEVAQAVLTNHGGLATGSVRVGWSAKDQFSGAVRDVELPQLLVGTTPVLRNDDPAKVSTYVDEVRGLVGGTVTLFQRMDAEGSLLRVATTVLTAQGRRAVGTFQPVTKPDGSRNPVLAEVLAGRTFTGEAQVLDQWFFTAYAPVRGADGEIVGAVYVGLPKD